MKKIYVYGIIGAIVVILVILYSFFGGIGEKSPPETVKISPTEKIAKYIYKINEDFSITLSDIERKENATTLYFTITKMSKGKSNFTWQVPETEEEYESELEKVPITLIDNHKNRYDGKLQIDLNYEYGGGFLINYFPKGFTYVDTVKIRMPKIAPIEKVKIADKEIPFKKIKLATSQFLKNFGDFTGIKSQKVRVGKWLSFTVREKIIPSGRIWQFPLTIENEDYNSASINIIFGTQLHDGRIDWYDSSGYRKKLEGLTKFSEEIRIVNARYCGYTEKFTHPKAFLVIGINESTLKSSLRIFPLTTSELPILVGQGTREMQKIFVEAYNCDGGREVMGDPLNLPHWFAGGNEPKDENDVLVQEFPGISDPCKSAIVWDKQGDAIKAYILHGAIWEKYSSLGGPYYTSKVQSVFVGAPTSDRTAVKPDNSYLRTEGSYNTFEGGAIASKRGEAFVVLGKIYQKWKEKDCGTGPLGFPTKEEQSSAISGKERFDITGLVQDFEGGRIYYYIEGKLAGEVLEIHGDIYRQYLQMGCETSWLGFPVTEEYRSVGKKRFSQIEFEEGYIGSRDGDQWEALPYGTGKIAFVSNRDENLEIYVTDTSGTSQVNLTNNPANDWDPVWSPDGSKIAFVSDREPRGIYLMDANGNNQKFLARGSEPAWFPDGSKIAFASTMKEKRARIFVMDPDGSNQVELAFNAAKLNIDSEDHRSPAVSPDSRQIAFQIDRHDHPPLIAIMNLDGTNVTSIYKLYRDISRDTMGYRTCRDPSWSPDGTKLTAVSYRGYGRWRAHYTYAPDTIYIINVHRASLEKLGVSGGATSWSSDGARIAFSDGKYIYIIHSDGSRGRRITKGEGDNWDPSWGDFTLRP